MAIVFVWILAVCFTLYSGVVTLRANFTAGTLVLWLISLCLVLFALFHVQVAAFCAHGAGRVLKYLFFSGVAVYIALFLFVAISGHTNSSKGDERAVIILGAGLRGESVSDVLRRRLVAGLVLWRQNPEMLIVVTGGQGPREAIPEAVAMRRWLLEQGVPEEQIILEDKSTTTEENLRFARALLEEAGIGSAEPVAVATNAFHCYRAGRYAAREGFSDVRMVPAGMNLVMLLPSYLREVLAVLALWLFKR